MSRWAKRKEKAVKRINPNFCLVKKNAIVFLIFFSELGCCCCCCSFLLLLLLLLQQQFATAVAARISNTQHTGDLFAAVAPSNNFLCYGSSVYHLSLSPPIFT
jgi:hypothetical protein